MSEPQQPPVPPYAQPGQSGQNPPAAPQPPAPQPYGAPQGQLAGQPYGAPQGQQPYGLPAAQGYTAAPAPGSANGLGRVAFIVAVITLAVTLLMTLAMPFVYRAVDFAPAAFGLFNGAIGLVGLVGSVAALVLGLMAIRRPGSHLLAGIAIGIAGSSILGTIVGWISSTFYGLF